MRPPTLLVLPLAIAALAAAGRAQFLNRAVWLGRDDEGVRSRIDRDTEYFLDRFAYVVPPPWFDPELRFFDPQARYAFGSATRSEFTIEGRIDHAVELGDGVTFRQHLLQSEHRDARFLRDALALEYDLGGGAAVFAQGELLPDKPLIDVSAGAWLWRRDHDALRVMLTAVDFANDKSRVDDYRRDPYGVMVAGAFGAPEAHRVVFELGAQLPFDVVDVASGDRLELWRVLGSVQAQLRLDPTDRLVGAIECERTDKALRPADPAGLQREDLDRTFHQARAEWWRDGASRWSFGMLHTWQHETGRRPNDPGSDLRERRREWYGIARTQLCLDDRLTFEPQLFAGAVREAFRDGAVDRDRDRFEGKLAWNVRWTFSPRASLTLVVSTQLDELAFGGGGAQFVAWF